MPILGASEAPEVAAEGTRNHRDHSPWCIPCCIEVERRERPEACSLELAEKALNSVRGSPAKATTVQLSDFVPKTVGVAW